MTDCIFCRIVARSLPSHVIHEDDQVLAFLDIQPVRPGHTQVVPKQHYASFDELPPELMAHIAHTAQKLSREMKKIYKPLRVGLVITGAHVRHVHAHVCPMMEEHDVTSGRYIRGPKPIFALPPRASDADLAREALALREAMAGD